jgi:hypothetical protein
MDLLPRVALKTKMILLQQPCNHLQQQPTLKSR